MSWLDDWEEYLTEPGDAELIICEAKARLEGLFTEQVQATLDEAKNAEEKLARLKCEIAGLENKKTALIDELHAKENLIVETDKQVPQKYVNAFVRDAIGDFAPGDTVWVLQYKQHRVCCPTCNGAKKILASINGTDTYVQCPSCNGYGTIDEGGWNAVEKKISEIDLTLCFSESYKHLGAWSLNCIRLYGEDISHSKKSLYKTKEEAEAAAKEKNQK